MKAYIVGLILVVIACLVLAWPITVLGPFFGSDHNLWCWLCGPLGYSGIYLLARLGGLGESMDSMIDAIIIFDFLDDILDSDWWDGFDDFGD